MTPDVEGQCNAWLLIADDYSDNACTLRCQLPWGHEGLHREEFQRKQRGVTSPVVVTWSIDQRPCTACEGTGYEGWTKKALWDATVEDMQEAALCSSCGGECERGAQR